MSRLKFALWGMLLVSPAALAEQTYDLGNFAKLSVNGFFKGEVYRNTNQSTGLTNCGYTNDPRGVFGTYCQPGTAKTSSPTPLTLEELSAGLSHEFDSAWKIDSRLSYRLRNGYADIVGQPMIEGNVAVSHPVYGELRAGTMLSRSWSRSDSFSYPLGMSSPWSESGAGYSLFQKAIRYSAPIIEFDSGGTLQLEGTLATNDIRYAQSAPTVAYNQAPPRPKLWELFAQYADSANLIEYVFQKSRGGQQSSWAKGPFVGDVGNADGLGITPAVGAYTVPTENVHILQGDHYFNPSWRATFGIRRNSWSGTAYQCDYVTGTGCYFPSGFNNGAPGTADNIAHAAWSVDFMGGISNFRGLWTYTAGFVRLNKAYTSTPVEYGQSNTATYINLGVNRRVPELYKDLNVYTGLGYVRFGRLGPAPLSMPSELAFFGVDPRVQSSAILFTLGAGLTF
ncbi:MAG TPA: hypothetical protein VMV35_04730 [Halothiobacillus sp.]|nr:hypothetical protein [Halothiobacillus sp.]